MSLVSRSYSSQYLHLGSHKNFVILFWYKYSMVFLPNQVLSSLLSPHALSPSCCCCPPSEWDGSRGEIFIAQRMSGHFLDLTYKACTEWWCVWQCYCAKNHLVLFSGYVCQTYYPYCKLKIKVLVFMLLCVTVCLF